MIYAVKVTVPLLSGRPFSEIVPGLTFLLVYDVVFLTLALLLFPAVVDE
jgi:hypothetical protein